MPLSEGLLPDGATALLHSVTVCGVRPDALAASSPEQTAVPTLQIYEPAMCCATGLCGPDPDEALVQFAADLKALTAKGVAVTRFNFSQTPGAFVDEPLVYEALSGEGMNVLPLIVQSGEVVSKGRYPSHAELARMVGLGDTTPLERAAKQLHPESVPASAGSCCSGNGGNSSSCC